MMSKKKTKEEIEERRLMTVEDEIEFKVDAEMFRDFFSMATVLVDDEVQLWIRQDGMAVRQMDVSRVSLTNCFLPKAYFKQLVEGKKVKEIRVSVRDFKAVINRVSSKDVLEVGVNKEGRVAVSLVGRRLRNFSIPFYELEDVERRGPTSTMKVKVKTALEGLSTVIEDADTITSIKEKKREAWKGTVTFSSVSTGLRLEASSDTGEYKTEGMLSSGWDLMQFEGETGLKTTVALIHIVPIIKMIEKVTKVVQLEFATNMPLHIIAELPLKGAVCEYWIAPRIEPEEEEVPKVKASKKEEVEE